ncbi:MULTISPECIES: hypothetical protein [Herbaspirillum]|uniref:hypothetical protein n=1 Tax=Herbaspirillum TaxID=963 RepID=UPI0002DF9C37|nr:MULTISPECIES: hypothetical protein [Herbaspirillum]
MSRKIGDGRDFWRPGNEDLPMLVERLWARQEDRAWLSGPERTDTGQLIVLLELDDAAVSLPVLTDPDYWYCALTQPSGWFRPVH